MGRVEKRPGEEDNREVTAGRIRDNGSAFGDSRGRGHGIAAREQPDITP